MYSLRPATFHGTLVLVERHTARSGILIVRTGVYFPGLARVLIVAAAVSCSAVATSIRVEHVDIPGGAELDTIIAGDFPLVSVLVDTLGDADPTNDELKNVWVLSYARPTVIQRIVAGLPFVYVRAGSPHRRDNSVPAPVLDMSAAGRNTWLKLLRAIAQSEVLDPMSLPVRASSRAYNGNTAGFRNAHIWQALNVLSVANEQSLTGALSEDDLTRVQARLMLSTHLFGDLVSESYLPAAFEKERDVRGQYRQHNWELLRQKAEENGLYFQPLQLTFSKNAHALLWAERRVPVLRQQSEFNSQFLGIENPFEGDWLEKWKGYTETWTLDENGSRTAEMVPVALYSLDYPKAPLLLADFRKPFAPKRHELIRRVADQITTGVLGLTTFGNLEYFAAKTTYTFIRRRHGGAVDRSARLRAYSEFRHVLYLDDSLDPTLRRELMHRVDGLGLNPFEEGVDTEAQLARDQYAALVAYAAAPDGLARKLERTRSKEVAHRIHSKPALAMMRVASITTLGIYRHTDRMTAELLSEVDRQRRFAWNKRFLEQAIGSTPHPEVAYNIERLQRSLDAITQIGEESEDFRGRSEALVRRVLGKTSDDGMRRRCYDCLRRLALHTVPKPTPSVSAGGDG